MKLLTMMAKMCCNAQDWISKISDIVEHKNADHGARKVMLTGTSYAVACFLAQNTVKGDSGLVPDVVIDELCDFPPKSEEEWSRILQQIAEDFGGWKEDDIMDNGRIFSGNYSREMWDAINSINALSTGDDIHNVLYLMGCKLQEFESRVFPDGYKKGE